MAGLDELSELLRQRAEDGDSTFSEEDLVGEVLSGLNIEADGIKSLKDLRTLLGTLSQTQGKFKDMEKGHTKATQRLSQIEEALRRRGIEDVDAFLTGGEGKVDRKQRLQKFFEKYDFGDKRQFWEELFDLTTPEADETPNKILELLGNLSEYVFFDQFNRDERYKDVDDETKNNLREKLRGRPEAYIGALRDLKNPLHGVYAEHFALTNPEVMQKKIDEKAREKIDTEKGSFLERPGAGRAPAKVETDTHKAQDQRADQIKAATGVDLRE